MKQLLLGIFLASIAATGASRAAAPTDASSAARVAVPDPDPANPARPRVEVFTSLGNFTIELNPERSPLTVANFLKYVDMGHYTNTLFHRTISNFVIQGGGYDTNYHLKSAPFSTVNESGNGLTNQRGTVGLARGTEPHSGDCQFYVNIADNSELDPSAARWGYAVFGKVVQGMDVVDTISNRPTGAKGPFKQDSPITPVVILRIERVKGP